MQQFTVSERVEIVRKYYENHECLTKTRIALQGKFSKDPSVTAIRNVISKFNTLGSVNRLKSDSRHKWARSNDIIEAVRESVARDPTASLRNRAKELGITRSTLRRILYDDLKMGVKEVTLMVDDNEMTEQREVTNFTSIPQNLSVIKTEN